MVEPNSRPHWSPRPAPHENGASVGTPLLFISITYRSFAAQHGLGFEPQLLRSISAAKVRHSELADIDELARDRRRSGHFRGHEMGASTETLTALEVAV